MIAFIGSVFSPYYAHARRKGGAKAVNHCAVNAVLYGPGIGRWSMTERGAQRLDVSADRLQIGPSAMSWDGTSLTIDIDEICVPFPRRIRGQVKVTPQAMTSEEFALNPDGDHRWWPIAPRARIEARFTTPEIAWSGTGYFDHNRGAEPVAQGFHDWTWSRAPLGEGAMVIYDGLRKDGSRFALGLEVDAAGGMTTFDSPPMGRLPTTSWRMKRQARSDPGHPAQVVKTLENTPFYARSLVRSRIHGREIEAVHESLSVDKFDTMIVQLMLPFRMPRRA